jgi:hypothetical protein
VTKETMSDERMARTPRSLTTLREQDEAKIDASRF